MKETERKRVRELFERETGEKMTYDELRQADWTGYTHFYLNRKFDIVTLETTAELEKVLEFVKLDSAEETKPKEIVFGCCNVCPILEFIEAVIQSTGAKIEDILTYQNENGNNCLMIMFQVLVKHFGKTGKDPIGSEMAKSIEQSVEYLIGLGDTHNLDINEILEKTNETGTTLFVSASVYSEKLAKAIMRRDVNLRSIDYVFQTPSFRFSSLHELMIDAGVNPLVRHYHHKTMFDFFKISVLIPPEMTSNLFFSTTNLPCNNPACPRPCSQDLEKAWYYNNGQVYDFEKTDLIGKGAEGAVLKGLFHGRKAAFKLVEIQNLEISENFKDGLTDLQKRLTEMEKLSFTKGSNILPFYGHVRQQLDAQTVNELGLGYGVKRFEVFITKKCDSNLADFKKNKKPTIEIVKCIIDQLIDSQEQLQAAGVSHNDIKPGNILIDIQYVDILKNDEVNVYIGDFGQADKKGGTPGWTSPEFVDDRIPGTSDMYSFGLVFLYLLCEDAELFYALRDNIIFEPHETKQWYQDFLNLAEIKLILQMIKPDPLDRILITDLKEQWNEIRGSVQMKTRERLNFPGMYESFQGNHSISELENLLGGSLQLSRTVGTFTKTHLQGDTEFCWLYSISSSIHTSLKNKTGNDFFYNSITDSSIRKLALKFLENKFTHQAFRNEILFGLIPKSLETGAQQAESMRNIMMVLAFRGILRKDQGLLHLLTVRRFFKTINETPKFSMHNDFIHECSGDNSPVVIVIGVDTTVTDSKRQFDHAIVMKECSVEGDTVNFKLKNSLKGDHLEGSYKISHIKRYVDREGCVSPFKLRKTTEQSPPIEWYMSYVKTYFVTFE